MVSSGLSCLLLVVIGFYADVARLLSGAGHWKDFRIELSREYIKTDISSYYVCFATCG